MERLVKKFGRRVVHLMRANLLAGPAFRPGLQEKLSSLVGIFNGGGFHMVAP